MRDDIQHILSGKSQVKHHHLIQTTCSYLKGSQGASSMAKEQKQHKEEETKSLIKFITQAEVDYYNEELGLILEDLHDENVLTQNGMLYFIDTVFYITSSK
jgi:hypothetical protein